ncbi:hypothetical protein B0H65DRAFT_445851 [Neurospora tetraspora]|uniref:Uncharacterized protein n=1 Tax=Neurospora tetraspora TaxID=94610 RepID=A0AAE0J6S1_9PEZI|nr:hypothetical protein B0H65DRAFT_445851 [Neurospora tetraspora]
MFSQDDESAAYLMVSTGPLSRAVCYDCIPFLFAVFTIRSVFVDKLSTTIGRKSVDTCSPFSPNTHSHSMNVIWLLEFSSSQKRHHRLSTHITLRMSRYAGEL